MTDAPPLLRVLFVTPHAFNKTTGTGVTFSNLFAGWPKDRIATVHDDSDAVSTDVCDRYFRLSNREIRRLTFGLSALIPGGTDRPTANPTQTESAASRLSWKGSSATRVRRAIFGDGLPQQGRLTAELASWIEDFKPDLLFTILGSIGLMQVVLKIQERFRTPLAVHFMDDWMSVYFRSGLLAPFQRRQMEGLVRQLIEKASVRLGICEAMCQAFERRYGKPFAPFQNAVDVERWADPSRDPGSVHDPVRVVYAGSVLPHAQLDSLADCCRAVAGLADAGRRFQLDIHGPGPLIDRHHPRLEIHPAIRIHPPLTDDTAFFSTLSAADILLMPSNFDDDTVRFIRYSMPTRVPAYLASGTPILVYGSPETAQVEYAREAGWGLIVNRRGPDSVADGLIQLASNGVIRRALSAKALATAVARHDATAVRRQFQKALAGAAGREV